MKGLNTKLLEELAMRFVDKARAIGLKADISIGISNSFSVEISDGEIESWESSTDQGAGIRVLRGNRQGFAYTNCLTWEEIERVLEEAVILSDTVDEDPYNDIARQPENVSELPMKDQKIIQMPVEEKLKIAKEIEKEARKYDKKIIHTRKASFSSDYSFSLLANTNDLFIAYEETSVGVGIGVIAQGANDMSTGSYGNQTVFLDDLPSNVGRIAAERALKMLDARSARTGVISVVMEPMIAVELISVISSLFSADEGQKGRSILWNKKGEKLFSGFITIVDDGTIPRAIGSSPTDGEGVKTRRKILVDRGTIKGYLYHIYSANKDGTESTGNGVRSYASLPSVGISNFFVEKGHGQLQDAIKDVDKGVLIHEILGLHTVNPISGEFSVGISGLWIENGEIAHPVRGITISDNIVDMMKKVDFVGEDLEFYGNVGSPTIRIREIVLGGSS